MILLSPQSAILIDIPSHSQLTSDVGNAMMSLILLLSNVLIMFTVFVDMRMQAATHIQRMRAAATELNLRRLQTTANFFNMSHANAKEADVESGGTGLPHTTDEPALIILPQYII